MDVWIDPRRFSTQFTDVVAQDFESQNIGFHVHHVKNNEEANSHNSDAFDIDNLISYSIIDSDYIGRLYILPRKKLLSHHDTIISMITKSLSLSLNRSLSMRQLEHAAALDPLTDCYNRRALCNYIGSDIAYAQRNGGNLSVIMFDLDNFKEINDRHGHLAGDAVLREISSLIRSNIRRSDYIARYGGEEFLLVLPDTNLFFAVQLADKLRKKIEEYTLRHGGHVVKLTASFGVASLENKRDVNSLLREVDERLYKAKSMGKNNVVPSLLPCFADRTFVSRMHTVSRNCMNASQVA
jgi:diguanylate cyclase (GGDEF)-like protein